MNAPSRISKVILAAVLFVTGTLAAQDPGAAPQESGRQQFEARCVRCHGADGAGGELGPDIVHSGVRGRSVEELRDLIRTGIPDAGMPAVSLSRATAERARRLRAIADCAGRRAPDSRRCRRR